ncbi:MAG: hypothetical protein IBX44_02190 [Sulfurospirillum sp.]|nr:hypothetical protein [Sulfurospirillum sp.]
MGKAKFINKVKSFLGIETDEYKKKKEEIVVLLEKLYERKKILKAQLNDTTEIPSRENLKDFIRIINKQIKKGKEFLEK